uniref:Cathepsin L1 n=1 Tax=Callorhinchus milii TaxID=7868 RepID=K4FSW4_CALMI|nr:cathepsin L1 [Callorhinchus milii]
MKFCLFILYILNAAIGSSKFNSDAKWSMWKVTHRKQYANLVEETNRRIIWQANLQEIKTHNMEYKRRRVSFKMGMNHFGDLSSSEFQRIYHHQSFKQRSFVYIIQEVKPFLPFNNSFIVRSVDWRKKGYVTPVYYQGTCGSCYGFAATGSLEAMIFKKYGKLIKLSEQSIVDCSSYYGNLGCSGGSIIRAYKFVMENGIQSADTYPYTAKAGTCRHNKSSTVATMSHYIKVHSNEEALAQTVSTVGPVAVCVHTKTRSWQFYKSGILYDPLCKNYTYDHGILVVGFGIQKDEHYWIVKNSWGSRWGMKGYIWIAKDRNNHCGISSYATYPE